MRTTYSLVALLGLSLAACAQPDRTPLGHSSVDTADPAATSATALASPLRASLPEALTELGEPDQTALAAFYRKRDFAPIWHDGGPYAEARDRIVAGLRAAGAAPPRPDEGDGVGRARFEVALTAAALQADATRAAAGDPVANALLESLAAAIDAAAPKVGPYPFAGQVQGLDLYATIVAAGGWPSVPDGPKLEPGALDGRVPALRDRLKVTGEYSGPASTDTRYDRALVAAVERFQERHGLALDGVVGPATLKALNVPAEARLAQLQQAATRFDAIAPRLGQRYVLVNLPAYELRYVRNGEEQHRTDVIVGSRKHQTVEFSDTIEVLVFNPYWNVPSSIARNELIHDFREDAARMAARGFKVVDASGSALAPTAVDWSTVQAGALPYRFRQGPGAGNALGLVKFLFPNEHAIYLHDTPSRSLFNRSMRALSHGCIRVRDPLDLAERLLELDGIERATIDGWVGAGRNRHIRLTNPVPVHLVYLTAWVEPDGTVHFRDDVYQRDRQHVRS